MDRAERERRYATQASAWRPQTIARVLCDLEDTYVVVVKERDLARQERDVARAWAKRCREALEMIESEVFSSEVADVPWCGAVARHALVTCGVEEQG